MTTSALGGLALVWSVIVASTRPDAQSALPPERAKVRLAPVADACIRAFANYGSKEWLAISGWSMNHPFPDDYTGVRTSFLKFDTGAVERASSARLRLYGATSSRGGPELWANVRAASNTWEENKLRGALTITDPEGTLPVGEPLDSIRLANDKTKRWYEWDVSEWVLREKAAGRHVVTLVLEGNDVAFFHSREARTNAPELVLVPEARPPAP